MIFADDRALCAEIRDRLGPLPQPVVECGGLEKPCVADYSLSVAAMVAVREKWAPGSAADKETPAGDRDRLLSEDIKAAQVCRYLDIHRPLSFLGDYTIENPETGGLALEDMPGHYTHSIGTAILLSVLEHVANPFLAIERLRMCMKPGGLVIVSVPWAFPSHAHGGEDNFRFSPTGLRHLFGDESAWKIEEAGFRLDIPAEAGVLQLETGRAQIIQSAYIVARAVT